jgi:hypothetical protein
MGTPTPPPPAGDGTDPATSATVSTCTASFPVTRTTTVTYSSTDIDGHAEATKSQVSGGGPPSGVARVVYLDGTTRLVTTTTAPYVVTWTMKKNSRSAVTP